MLEIFVTARSDSLDGVSGRVRVNEFGQLIGHPNVYAVGDVAVLPKPEQSLGYFAGLQGKVPYQY